MPIELGYAAREHFVPFHKRRQRWAVMVAHRRAGKTVACVMDLIDAALRCDKLEGRFAYVAPTYTQAKDVAWNYLKRFTGPIVSPDAQRESDLSVNLPNGARIRLYGAENYERLRGLYFDQIVLDEFGDMDPRAWAEVVRPALSDRNGSAVFIGTPKGRNHFFEKWEEALASDDWFCARLKASETGIIAESELADARRTMTADQYEQEYEVSFDAAVVGTYYAPELRNAEADKRIGRVIWDPKLPVHTAWDLGRGASNQTSIWMWQRVGREVRLIDFECGRDGDLAHYVKALATRPYTWGTDLLPHDAEPKRLQTGESVQDTLRGLGRPNSVIVPVGNVSDGINAVRALLPRCFIDEDKCKYGLDALRNYRREWDARLKVFKANPLHDWTSDPADAMRMLAMGEHLISDGDTWGKPLAYPKLGIT